MWLHHPSGIRHICGGIRVSRGPGLASSATDHRIRVASAPVFQSVEEGITSKAMGRLFRWSEEGSRVATYCAFICLLEAVSTAVDDGFVCFDTGGLQGWLET